VGISTEFKYIELAETNMFDKLPERVRKSLSLHTAEFRWNVFDSRVKAHVGVLPIENPLQMSPKRVIAVHDVVLQSFNARAQGRKGAKAFSAPSR
jgi:hypothetical protein